MNTAAKLSSQYWFGRYGKKALLYDPEFQIPDYPYVFLWDIDQLKMLTFSRERARVNVRKVDDDSDRNVSIQNYLSWLETDGEKWLKDQQDKFGSLTNILELQAKDAALKLAEADRLKNLHQTRLESIGVPYQGVRSTHKFRSTICWSCHLPLTSNIELECIVCSWLLCRCSACGCRR